MKVMLLALLVLVLPMEVVAMPGAVWTKHRVKVLDFTPLAWQDDVAETIAAYNAVMPRSAPRLVYVPMQPAPCPFGKRAHRQGAIAMCNDLGGDGLHLGLTTTEQRSRVIRGALVRLFDDGQDTDQGGLRAIICHELMHALFGAPHRRQASGASCIWAWAESPGSADARYAKKVHRTYDSHHSGPRDRTRGKHR